MKPSDQDPLAILSRSEKTREKTERRLKRRRGVQPSASTVDLAAIRASVRKAVVDAEVEKKVAASTDQWLTHAQVEKITRLGRTTIWTLRRTDPTFPKPERPTGGRAIRFRETAIRHWMVGRERKPTNEA